MPFSDVYCSNFNIARSLTDIIYVMGIIRHKKRYEVSSEGWITVYPSLHENKEKGMLKRILKWLIQLKKGH